MMIEYIKAVLIQFLLYMQIRSDVSILYHHSNQQKIHMRQTCNWYCNCVGLGLYLNYIRAQLFNYGLDRGVGPYPEQKC